MKKRVYIFIVVLAGGILSTHIQPEPTWYERPVSFVNDWLVQPVVGFFRRLFTMIGRGGKRTLVALTAMVRMQRQQETDAVIVSNFTPDCAAHVKNDILFFTINDGLDKIEPKFSNVLHMFVSPNKRLLCIVHSNSTEIVQRTENDQLIRVHTFGESFDRGWWSPDSTMLAVRNSSGQLTIYRVAQGFKDSILSQEHVDQVSWSPDSQTIAIQDINRRVRLIEINTKNVITEIEGVIQMAWTPRTRFFAAVTQTGEVHIFWKQAHWNAVQNDLQDVASIIWTPRRDLLLVTTNQGKSSLYKSPTQPGDHMQKIDLMVNNVQFEIPDNAHIFFSPTAQYIAIINVADKRRLSLFKLGSLSSNNRIPLIRIKIGPHDTLYDIEMLQWIDQEELAVLNRAKNLEIYNSMQDRFTLTKYFVDPIHDISVSPDEDYMLIHQKNNSYALFNLTKARYLLLSPKLSSITTFYWM